MLLLAVVGCGGGDEQGAIPKAPSVGTLLGALLGAADDATEPWRCAALDAPGFADATLTAGEATWRYTDHGLKREGTDAEIAIGVVADAGGGDARTIAALGRTRAAFDVAKLDLVVTLGGMGATADELQATLGTLSERASWVTVVLPGDLEPMTAHLTALATLRARGDAVVDGRRARWIEMPGATIATVPGAGAVERLVAGGDGCAWQSADIVAIVGELTRKEGLRIVATSEAPRQTVDGEATGAVALAPSTALPVDVILHGPIVPTPTGPRRGTRGGDGAALSPGTSDATTRLPSAHRSAAGILVIRGGGWSWRPVVDSSP